MNQNKVRLLEYEIHGDERGSLVALEQMKSIPFEVKRVYFMYDTEKGYVRGCHAHKNLEQVLVCVHGSCMIKLDDGTETRIIRLDNPNEGLYIGSMIWREMSEFSDGSVLLAIASELYDEDDYIRDYDEFILLVGVGG